jgi:hypothetical protein
MSRQLAGSVAATRQLMRNHKRAWRGPPGGRHPPTLN